MQIRNAQSRHVQFFFYKDVDGTPTQDFVHIPGGATVELDDKLFETICAAKTVVDEMREVNVVLDEANIAANVKMGKEILTVKEYVPTGKRVTVSLVREMIKRGDLEIVERPAIAMADVDAFLNAQGISVKEMDDEQKMALYDKLA